eukprot:15249542-Alexandrium_andersonii.AAC.1
MEQARATLGRARMAYDQAWDAYVRWSTRQAPRALIAQAWGMLQRAKACFHQLRYAYAALAGLGHLWLRWLTWWPGGALVAQ